MRNMISGVQHLPTIISRKNQENRNAESFFGTLNPMKKILTIALLSGLMLNANAQKLEKFEDVLPRILALPPSGALAQLKIYKKAEPENVSIDFQMAVIYERRYRNSDPIKDYAYKLGNAQEALKAFEKSRSLVTEKEVKRNQEYYINFGRLDEKGRLAVPYDTVNKHMNAAIVELGKFIKHMPGIYEKFTGSFTHYDKAHKTYTQILGEYPTFKDLYLLFNSDVDKQFETVKSEYLLAMKYWSEYESVRDSLKTGYHQNMSVKPIKIYRLEGLESKINFLQNNIAVWDYANWVDETRKIIHAEVDKLRLDLAAENIRLEKQLAQAEPDFIRETFEPLKVSKEVLFNLRKYDLNSVIEPVFLYKEKKHDLLYQELLSAKLDTARKVSVDRKLYLYGQMINRIKDADSVLADVGRRNTKESLEKYNDFIKTQLKGQSGINQLVTQERSKNATDADHYVDNIRKSIYKILRQDSIAKTVKYKKLEIALKKSLPVADASLTAAPVTTHQLFNYDSSQFVAGIMKNEKAGFTQTFVCGVTKDKKIGWYNEYLLQIDSSKGFDSHTRIAAMQIIPGGLAIILNGTDATGNTINHLFLLDEKGQTTHSRRMVLNQYPRNISFDERSNSLFVVYKGTDFEDDIFQQTEIIMANYSIYGDLLWQKRAAYKGNIADIVHIDNGYLLVGNFNELKDLSGKIQRAGSGSSDTKIFALTIDLAGEIKQLKTVEGAGTFYARKAFRVSDDCINLMGSKGVYNASLKLDENPQTAVHLIMNKDLEVLASTLN